jgi:type I restriction enzyme, R subunit
LSEGELAVFDLLTKPELPPLTDKEKDEVKKISRDLLGILQEAGVDLDEGST